MHDKFSLPSFLIGTSLAGALFCVLAVFVGRSNWEKAEPVSPSTLPVEKTFPVAGGEYIERLVLDDVVCYILRTNYGARFSMSCVPLEHE